MARPDERNTRYLHGSDASEQARLEAMVQILGGIEFLPPLKPGMRVLDLGCGTGTIAREVAGQVASGQVAPCQVTPGEVTPGEVIGVDQQEAQLATARRLAAERGIENITFRLGEATELDFGDGEFDGAYCRFLLEHVAKPVDVVREMARVVKLGGWVCAFEWENGCSVVYPDCPAVTRVWQAIYDLQDATGGDSRVARKLFEVFRQAGLRQVEAEGRAWSITANDQNKLNVYVDGAREIIRQTRDRLLSQDRVTTQIIEQADSEYRRLLESPVAFVTEGYGWATGQRGPTS